MKDFAFNSIQYLMWQALNCTFNDDKFKSEVEKGGLENRIAHYLSYHDKKYWIYVIVELSIMVNQPL